MKIRQEYDAFLIGTGIMSTTLASLLKEMRSDWNIGMVERCGTPSLESSGSFNNAGTGHSGFCELNYDLKKAVDTCESFEKSKQYWSYLIKKQHIQPGFIHQVPHISFVTGQQNLDELKKRYFEMKKNCLFADMEFSDDTTVLKSWMPLVTFRRNRSVPIAATRVKRGTDVDFGALTNNIISHLILSGVDVNYYQHVYNINKSDEKWIVSIQDRLTKEKYQISTKFLFIGSGGATLTLLQKSGIPEAKEYGGFPVSGQFLMCDHPDVVKQHSAKVYGKPEIGAPPMSQPHFDTRIINGKKVLLFGPYAAFSTKFLKQGRWSDFFKSLRYSNVFVILFAGLRNLGLSKYLLKQVIKTNDGRFNMLLEYYPTAEAKDWKLITAGQRVQVIKKDKGIPTIEFGTEIVTDADGTLAALLGASPGASCSVSAMLDIMKKCFSKKPYWIDFLYKLDTIIPSYGCILHEEEELFKEIEKETNKYLEL